MKRVTVYVMCLFSLSGDCANEALCDLPTHPSVEYRCLSNTAVFEGISSGAFRACRDQEPAGAIISPQCRSPNYYTTTALGYMRCKNGKWDHIAKCIPECGLVTPAGEPQVLGGESAKRAEVPWHVGIYTKTTSPYMQLCGGTLISNKIIISAAHCFWDNIVGKLSAKDFAAAVGKLYRPWNERLDKAQQSDVKALHFPEHFQGSTAYYQADIAVVIVTTPFSFNRFVRPVCVDFDINFEKIQLQPGKMGKVAGWGLTADNGNPSPVLKVIKLPYIGTGACITGSPDNFRPYITTDKFCAGYKDGGMAVCKGDSGGGLVFPETVRGKERHYLRGIVSAAPTEDFAKCNANAYTSFTQLLIHEHFVKQFWVAEDALNADTEFDDDDDFSTQNGDCQLPPFPDHGSYVTNVPTARPGNSANFILFNVSCDEGYRLDGVSPVYCYKGLWQAKFPKCVGNPCDKSGVAGAGVCTDLGECPTAIKDFRNGKTPQICAYSSEPVVCCVRTDTNTSGNAFAESAEGCEPLPPTLSSQKTGRKAWDKCLEYQERLVYPCRKSYYEQSRINNCHHNGLSFEHAWAAPHEFSHMALLGYGKNLSAVPWWGCTGSLISEKFILTAAHCTSKPIGGDEKVTIVQLGPQKIFDKISGNNWYTVKRTISHPDYKPPAQYHDIALLELEKPVPLDEFTVPACLHTGEQFEEDAVSAPWWGFGSYPYDLTEVTFLRQVIGEIAKNTTADCSRVLHYSPEQYPAGFDPDTQTCYADVNLKILKNCQYTLGGPLQVNNKKINCMYSIIGVRSWYTGCVKDRIGYLGKPDFFTTLTSYLDWIETIVWP